MSSDIAIVQRMDTEVVPSDQVRFPRLRPGTATAVHRYDKERAFVLHPDDFHRLAALDELAVSALGLPSFELSAAAVNAHHEESTPGRSVTDPHALKSLLDG
jgi:hypothetical protein